MAHCHTSSADSTFFSSSPRAQSMGKGPRQSLWDSVLPCSTVTCAETTWHILRGPQASTGLHPNYLGATPRAGPAYSEAGESPCSHTHLLLSKLRPARSFPCAGPHSCKAELRPKPNLLNNADSHKIQGKGKGDPRSKELTNPVT